MAASIQMYRNAQVVAALALCAVLLPASLKLVAAREYVVGGKQGWLLPASPASNYSTWALRHKYYVGDSLMFNYPPESDALVEVNRQHFDACNSTDPIATYGDGKTTVKLTSTGPLWFISGVSNNCNQGQKFGIMVFARPTGESGGSQANTSPELAPAPAPVPHAPAPENDASSLAAASVTPLLLALIALFSWYN